MARLRRVKRRPLSGACAPQAHSSPTASTSLKPRYPNGTGAIDFLMPEVLECRRAWDIIELTFPGEWRNWQTRRT